MTLTLKISEKLLTAFSDLTGDHSSLHTQSEFSRRSQYRERVVHGMCPISLLPFLLDDTLLNTMTIISMTGKFVAPIKVDQVVTLSVTPTDNHTYRFDIHDATSKSLLIKGLFKLGKADHVIPLSIPTMTPPSGLLTSPFSENDYAFSDIEKGLKDSFSFMVTPATILNYIETIKEDIPLSLPLSSTLTNWISAGLLSTFVGMGIPGKTATFLDFDYTFNTHLLLDVPYTLEGEVIFTSASTHVIKEALVIKDIANKPIMNGTALAKVNLAPPLMPTIDELKQTMDFGLENKTIFISGASRGLGETMAKLLSLYGANIVINYFKGKSDAERIAHEINHNGGKAIAVGADITNPSDVEAAIEMVLSQFGSIDILINNAVNSFNPIPFSTLTWEDILESFETIVKGSFLLSQKIVPIMQHSQGGKIINMGSIATETPPPHQSRYVMAKSALVGLTRSLASELASKHIQVNLVVPNMVQTDLTKHIHPMFIKDIEKNIPMQRIATATDIAKTVLYLCSSLSSYTTGQKIMVTGGELPFL